MTLLDLQEICAKTGIQLHEHMRVPRQSMAGGLGIDAPPADLKVTYTAAPWTSTDTVQRLLLLLLLRWWWCFVSDEGGAPVP